MKKRERSPMTDNVNHPSHYNMGGIEVIDAIESWGFGEGFNRGNAIKYIARAGRKDPACTVEDLEKARFYIEREIQRLSQKPIDLAAETLDTMSDALDIRHNPTPGATGGMEVIP